jgi:hypothetical protein
MSNKLSPFGAPPADFEVREQHFKCICGAEKVARARFRKGTQKEAFAPPASWQHVTLTNQHPVLGVITVAVAYACSKRCAERIAAGEGPAAAILRLVGRIGRGDSFHTEEGVPPAADGSASVL